jgi:DNA repair protein RecO (recombination protein O)
VSIKRYADEPGFVLHRYDWSESSLILDVFTRHFGRVALVAKGAKRPTSQLRPVLLPLQPLLLAWAGDAEVRTLKTAHWRGGHVMPVGEALLAGTYFNEMLLKLLARDDPHPVLYDGYTQAVHQLAHHRSAPDAAVLRAFELLLLREVGYLPSLAEEGSSLAPLQPDAWYVLETEGGLALSPSPQRGALQGAYWQTINDALTQTTPFTSLVQACRPCMSALQPVLRHLLHYHSGVRSFKTRQMMLDVQALVRKR